uniref:Uncharacterized protein n=1 Tax=Knipowitschia caucasica TaxID=637954 RepID=A0AAV2MST3_KNICA
MEEKGGVLLINKSNLCDQCAQSLQSGGRARDVQTEQGPRREERVTWVTPAVPDRDAPGAASPASPPYAQCRQALHHFRSEKETITLT